MVENEGWEKSKTMKGWTLKMRGWKEVSGKER